MFYCLQALVVPSKANGEFNANRNRGESGGGCAKKRKIASENDFILHGLLLCLQVHTLDFVQKLAVHETNVGVWIL